MTKEELKKAIKSNAFLASSLSATLVVDLETVLDLIDELQENAVLPDVVEKSEQLKCVHQWRSSGGYAQCCKCGEFGNATT